MSLYRSRRYTYISVVALLLLIALPASAQFRPGGPGGPGRGPTKVPKAKPAGPAEAAPENNAEDNLEDPDVSWHGEVKKQVQFFKLDGYLRLRGDLFSNVNLGMIDTNDAFAPFYRPLGEQSSLACENQPNASGCPRATVSGANMRFRLEPTFNIKDTVRIKSQIDIFDNLVLGSTPNGLNNTQRAPHVPLTAFSDSQAPPLQGINSNKPSILVKRVWAEVDTPVGRLYFGRMPSQWGLGLLANDGSCWDCNFGDNQDRIMFATKLFQHFFAVGYDIAASGPNSLNVASGITYTDGPVVDLEDLDDVDQFFFALGRRDSEETLRKRVAAGEFVINYGAYFVYRKQDFDYTLKTTFNVAESDLINNITNRSAWAAIPDVWFKIMWKRLYVEFEGLMIAGKIDNVSNDPNKVDKLDILQYGFALKAAYSFLRKKNLKVGLEIGMASGDQTELERLNRRRFLQLQDPNDTKLTEMRFDYDYQVDLILFREILGTVSNATYFKPWISYDLTKAIGARFDLIYSLAHTPVAYPGNNANLGVELDFDLYYNNKAENFYAGLQYGVLFPLKGLDRIESIYGSTGAKGAEIAQTLQARVIVKF